MAQTTDFDDKPINKILNYIHWFFLTSIYFNLANILFILAIYTFDLRFNNLLIFFIALVPSGPAITALCSCMNKIIFDKYIDTTRDFFKGYKENFILSMKFWIPLLCISSLLIFDIKLCFVNGKFLILQIPLILMLTFSIVLASYVFPIVCRYKIKLLDSIKLAIYLSFKNLLNTIINLLIISVSTYLFINSRGLIGFFLSSIACFGILLNLKSSFRFIQNKFIND